MSTFSLCLGLFFVVGFAQGVVAHRAWRDRRTVVTNWNAPVVSGSYEFYESQEQFAKALDAKLAKAKAKR